MAALAASLRSGLTLYTAGTPNGWKASICLEELGVSYAVHHVDLAKGEQKSDPYLAINPNGRIPAIVDHSAGDLAVWESGAVLHYLAGKDLHGRLLPADARGRHETLSWLFWQVGGLGPMAGQVDWFLLFAQERDDLALGRYTAEVQRLLGVMETRLQGRQWLAADRFTIADIACFPWVLVHDLWGIPLSPSYPNLRRWVDAIKGREAVQRGLNVPEANPVLHHSSEWQDWLARARKRLEGTRPAAEPEE